MKSVSFFFCSVRPEKRTDLHRVAVYNKNAISRPFDAIHMSSVCFIFKDEVCPPVSIIIHSVTLESVCHCITWRYSLAQHFLANSDTSRQQWVVDQCLSRPLYCVFSPESGIQSGFHKQKVVKVIPDSQLPPKLLPPYTKVYIFCISNLRII